MYMNDILNCTTIEKRDLDNVKLIVENKIKKLNLIIRLYQFIHFIKIKNS